MSEGQLYDPESQQHRLEQDRLDLRLERAVLLEINEALRLFASMDPVEQERLEREVLPSLSENFEFKHDLLASQNVLEELHAKKEEIEHRIRLLEARQTD